MNRIGIVAHKELVDLLRDRRTLLVVLLSSIATGPLILLLMSALAGRLEQKAEAREVYLAKVADAPSLKNYFERQTFAVREAPADYEAQLRNKKFTDPVLVVDSDFEQQLERGEVARIQIISSSDNQQAESSVGRVTRLLRGFGEERALGHLISRGVSPGVFQIVRVDEHDIASSEARGAMFMMMLPFILLIAVLTGAMTGAVDSTAGERERGSLEPLLLNPVRPVELVIGKWLAVAVVGVGSAVVASLSFLPAQVLMKSERLSASFRFGVPEVLSFIQILVPFAASAAALFMVLAIRSKTVKEAQAACSAVMMALTMPSMVTTMLDQGDAKIWKLVFPGTGQGEVMMSVLKGESLSLVDVFIPLAVAIVITVACLSVMTARLRATAVR